MSLTRQLLTLCLLALAACAARLPPGAQHVVLGSGSHGYPAENIRVLTVMQGADFEARHSQLRHPECTSGSLDVLEFSGVISSTSVSVINNMIKSVNPCIRRDGRQVVSPVYLNSAQGDWLSGMQLGQSFQNKGVEVMVTEGQRCESACAVAYLGAQRKQVLANGRVVLHFNGEQGRGFDCARSVDMMPLRNYLLFTAGKQQGQALFNQALVHCRRGQGWELS